MLDGVNACPDQPLSAFVIMRVCRSLPSQRVRLIHDGSLHNNRFACTLRRLPKCSGSAAPINLRVIHFS